MSSTPESRVKRRVTAALTTRGAYWFYPVTGGFGRSGVPDIIACYRGRFVGIECKAGKGAPTALQQQNLARIRVSGGVSLVVNENNIHELMVALEQIDAALDADCPSDAGAKATGAGK